MSLMCATRPSLKSPGSRLESRGVPVTIPQLCARDSAASGVAFLLSATSFLCARRSARNKKTRYALDIMIARRMFVYAKAVYFKQVKPRPQRGFTFLQAARFSIGA